MIYYEDQKELIRIGSGGTDLSTSIHPENRTLGYGESMWDEIGLYGVRTMIRTGASSTL